MAVERCREALLKIGPRLNGYVDGRSEYERAKAESVVLDATAACDEARTQVSVDGYYGAAVMLSEKVLDLMPLRLGLSVGNPKSLRPYLSDYEFFGPLREWQDDLLRELGVFPPESDG